MADDAEDLDLFMIACKDEDTDESTDAAVAITNMRTSLSRFTHTPLKTTGSPDPSPLRRSPRIHYSLSSLSSLSPALKGASVTVSENTTPTKRKLKTEAEEDVVRRRSVKRKRSYAPPETYAHLDFLTDYLAEELDVLFCGINPGYVSAKVGYHYANPTNHFWRCLHLSGLTDRLMLPSEEHVLPGTYRLGLTDLVERPSTEQAELSMHELADGVPVLLQKISKYRPRIVCFVGKGIWLLVEQALKKIIGGANGSGRKNPAKRRAYSPSKERRKDNGLGLQPYKVEHPIKTPEGTTNVKNTLFFTSVSTSGRVASHQLSDKAKLFTTLCEYVQDHKEGKIDLSGMATLPSYTNGVSAMSRGLN